MYRIRFHQEVLDSVLLACRLAEHPRVRLPVIINLDGFYLSVTRVASCRPSSRTPSRFAPASRSARP